MAADLICTFAGEQFRWPDPALVQRLERFGFPRDLFPERIIPGPALQRIGFPDPLPHPPQRLNQFFYPVGASRCGVFRGVMDADTLTAVKALVWSSNTTVQASATFTIKSKISATEAADPVSTSMYLLSAFPVAEKDGETTLYVVTLVDERYFWYQQRNGGVINCLSATDTWSEVIDQLATKLGITLTYSAPSSDYGYPEPDSPLYSNYENPAILLDMVAANVGCAVVRAFDGTYSLQRWDDAVGGSVDNRLTKTGFGGRIVDLDSDDYRSIMPASVMVVFPKWIDDDQKYAEADSPSKRAQFKDSYGVVYTSTKTLADLGAPYSAYANTGLTKVLHTTFRARYDTSASALPNNETACGTLALKLAKDYYDARTVWIDESYRSVADLTPNGVSDFLFCFDSLGVYTRAMAPPLNAGYHNFQHGPVQGGIDAPVREELKGLTFTADTSSQTDSDPGPGKMRWNDATQGSATELYFDNLTADGVDVSSYWALLGSVGFLYLQQSDDATRWQLWKWTAVPVDGTGYYKFTVALQAISTNEIQDAKTVYTNICGLPDASLTESGIINTIAQVINGIKTFDDEIYVKNNLTPATYAHTSPDTFEITDGSATTTIIVGEVKFTTGAGIDARYQASLIQLQSAAAGPNATIRYDSTLDFLTITHNSGGGDSAILSLSGLGPGLGGCLLTGTLSGGAQIAYQIYDVTSTTNKSGGTTTTAGLEFCGGLYISGSFSGATLPISLTTDVTGILPEANGGTGYSTLTAALDAAGGISGTF